MTTKLVKEAVNRFIIHFSHYTHTERVYLILFLFNSCIFIAGLYCIFGYYRCAVLFYWPTLFLWFVRWKAQNIQAQATSHRTNSFSPWPDLLYTTVPTLYRKFVEELHFLPNAGEENEKKKVRQTNSGKGSARVNIILNTLNGPKRNR